VQIWNASQPGAKADFAVGEMAAVQPVKPDLVIYNPTRAKLVRTLVDCGQCFADSVGQGIFSGQGVVACTDLDGAVAA